MQVMFLKNNQTDRISSRSWADIDSMRLSNEGGGLLFCTNHHYFPSLLQPVVT